MIEEKVKGYFNKFPDLRVLFFFDEHQEYLEEVKKLLLPDIEIEYWEENPFSLKCKLLEEYRDSRVLLHLPMKHPQTQEEYHNFPLMGLLLANKELRLDNVGAFLEEYGLQRHQKSLISKYIKELKYSGVQEVCKPVLTSALLDEPLLQKALVSSFLRFKKIETWPLLIAKLLTLTNKQNESELKRVLNKIEDLKITDEVIKRVKEITGFPLLDISRPSLLQVGRSVLYNKLTQNLSSVSKDDPYSIFKINDSTQLTRLNQMLQEIDRNTAIKNDFDSLLKILNKDVKGETLIDLYGTDADFYEYNSEMIWIIISKIQSHIESSPAEVIKKLENISIQPDLESLIQNILKYVIQVAKMHRLIGNSDSYILDSPQEYIKWYTKSLYKIDTAYRRAISEFKNLDMPDIPNYISIDDLHYRMNEVYDQHTDKLNREWLKCLDQFNFDYSKISVPKQYDFYDNEIRDVDQKVVVVISDALRYEAGYELLSKMHADSKNTAELRYMMASIPSKTNVGMAQLLPGNKKIFQEGKILSEGISTSGSANREKILVKFKTNSKAIQYGDLEGLDRKKVREIFKNDVVYVYHDVIDAIGDKKPSERRTFTAVEDAINELEKFIKLLHGSYNVAKVFITADHGFLYNDNKIKEKDKEDLPDPDSILSHNRYYFTESQGNPDLGYSIPLSATTVFEDSIYVNIPFSVNRYKKGGVGHQFVHGGGSLQELIVPLIESSRKREEIAKKVTPLIINKDKLRVVSNIVKLNILQENEVSRTEKERTLSIGLYNDNVLVSNEEQLLLNYTSESPSERMARVELTLAPIAENESFLKLKVFDIEDKLNPLIEIRIQNNTLIQTDF